MSEDDPTCSACGRREEKCVCDNPMTNPPERTAAIQTMVGHIVREHAETLRKLAQEEKP